MLQSVNELKGYDIIAADGVIGSIEEFYFEDTNFKVRYLVANTGNWLTGRQNLISPQAITHLDTKKQTIHISLTREQVTKSPDIDKHQPVSRQMERLVSDYYGDTYYWDDRPNLTPNQLAAANSAAEIVKTAIETGTATAMKVAPDVHLRSMQEVATYNIAALDGEIGEVEDFFVETDDWTIRYIGVDTGNWLPGKHVLISALWLGLINWSQRKFGVNLTRGQIENCPDFDKVTQITREYETRLYNHYGFKTTN